MRTRGRCWEAVRDIGIMAVGEAQFRIETAENTIGQTFTLGIWKPHGENGKSEFGLIGGLSSKVISRIGGAITKAYKATKGLATSIWSGAGNAVRSLGKKVSGYIDNLKVKLAPKMIEGKNFFREVEIVNAKGSPLGEFDEIDLARRIFFEDKTAKGLNKINPRTGLPAQTIQEFADKQILEKTRNRIDNLLNQSVSTRATVNGTQNVPTLEQIKDINHFVFRLDGDAPQLRNAVANSLDQLRVDYPSYVFEAMFGVKK